MKGYVWLLSSILGLFAMWPVMGLSTIFLLLPIKASLVLKKRFVFFFSSLLLDWFAIILMYFGGTKVFVHSKSPDLMKERGNIIMCNHRTRVDWMFAGWCFNMMTSSRNTKNHVILKEGLKKVPIFGWCMQLLMYTFLTRKKESDLPHINKSVRCMRDIDPDSNILIFPEGTDMSDENITKNDEFATKNNLTKTKNVLYPKSLGLLTCISNWGNKNKSLIDITIIYKNHDDVKRASEVELMKGRFPKEIHLFCDQYKLSDVPTDSQTLTAWLYDIFLKKEKRIDQFNETISKSTTSFSSSAAAAAAPSSTPGAAASINKLPLFESYSLIASSHCESGSLAVSPSNHFVLFISLCMISLIFAVFHSLIYYPIFRYYMALISALTVLSSVLGNGWDIIELAIYDKFITSSSNNDDHID